MDWHAFHFMRPLWLLALLPWLLVLLVVWRQHRHGGVWEKVIDPRLRPFVLMGAAASHRSRLALWLGAITTALMILAQAGPVWQKRPQPLFKQKSALVIALDLSRSMDAADLRPSRLARARFKVNDILDRRKDGQTALLVWAATPFTVTPLTDDVKTIRALVPSLTTDMMPSQGSRADRAVNKAVELMKNAGQLHGDILLLTDGVSASDTARTAIKQAERQGYRVSILAIGTAAGAPISLPEGGFLKDANGGIVIPKLDSAGLQTLAQLGGGRFSPLTAGDSDVNALLAPINQPRLNSQGKKTTLNTDSWYEQGPWLLLLALPLAALLFRRGEIFLLLVFLLPLPKPAQAVEWQDLWLNQNQLAAKLLQQKKPAEAAAKFTDPRWKAAAEYRAGKYQEANKHLQQTDDAESWYNRGNALAKAGQLPQALSAFATALEKNPQHADAKYNKALVEKALQKQQQKNQQNQKNASSDSSKNQQQSGQPSEKQKSEKQQSQDSQSQSSQADSKDASAQDAKQQPSQDSQTSTDPSQQHQDQSQNKKASAEEKSADNKDDTKEAPEKAQAQAAQQAPEKPENPNSEDAQTTASRDEKPLTDEQRATQQWLRRIPDDPGGLLRRKFRYQYQQQQQGSQESQAW